MPPEMPTLGSQQPKKMPVLGVAITALVVGAVAGGLYWWKTPSAGTAVTPPAPVAAPEAPVAVAPAAAPTDGAVAPAPVAAAPAAKPATKPDAGGLKSFTATINGPLEQAIVGAVGKEVGQPLTQVVTRSLVWWLAVPGDLLKGDELQVVYEDHENQEPTAWVVRLTSKKFGKTFEAYRFKAASEQYAKFYQPSGEELELRLVDGPLDSWEQVTSLLRDGRHHKGVDFKTAVGTPVKATFDGTVVKKNWFFKGNGNSIEIAESGGGGRTAKFLHLSEIPKTLVAGSKVAKGEVVAKSGNTGHSFAPHLHYQLEKGEKVIDPFESHKTFKKSLEAADKPKLELEIARLKGLIGAAGGQVAGAFGRP